MINKYNTIKLNYKQNWSCFSFTKQHLAYIHMIYNNEVKLNPIMVPFDLKASA